jgi:TldD protein
MISKEIASKVLAAAMKSGGDFAEIYVEDRTSLNLGLDESKLETAVRGADRGAGIRVFFGNLVTYAYTDNLSDASLLKAAEAAGAAGTGSNGSVKIDLTERKSPLNFPVEKAFDSMSIAEKAASLSKMDETARSYDSKISQVQANYFEMCRRVWIFNSEGLYVEDERNMVEMRGTVFSRKGDIIQRSGEGFGGQLGVELFDYSDPIELITKAAESAVRMLDARPAPAGDMTVVMPNGWGGVLFHEACGHAMEADFITKKSSVYADRVGEQVASKLITAIDDATIPKRRGSFRFDDDGTPAQKTVLIENGILKEYMWDKVEARRAGRESTGNGRRQDFRHVSIPRMTNTYIAAGEHDPQEIIESVKNGLYIKSMSGGQADIAKGDFVFSASEAFLIEDGKLTTPIRGATIMGNGPEVLKEIDMVGNDLALDPGMGMCGKGQGARCGVGQPTIRIPSITVGGIDKPMSGQMG